MKSFNKFIKYRHFKIEGINVWKDIIHPLDFFTTIDLKDVYLTGPIFTEHKKILHIRWKGVLCQFTCLCFDLVSARWTFTKLLKAFVAFLRRRGIRLIIYLNDILILSESKIGAEREYALTAAVLEQYGFLVNLEKSIGEASQRIEYLGLIADEVSFAISLLEEKVSCVPSPKGTAVHCSILEFIVVSAK